MKISIIICTLNRHQILRSAIISIIEQSLPKELYEIMVIDNGSEDETKEVVEMLSSGIPNMVYCCEPKKGLSIARNRGIRESTGDIVAFLDDDAVAHPEWLERLYTVYNSDPDVGAAVGKILVLWEHGKPAYVDEYFEGYFGKFNQGEMRKTLIFPDYLFGSNMSLRRNIALEVGGFREDLGRKGKNLLAAEETDLFYRLSLKGIKVVYEPNAVVYHRVLAERLSRCWGLRRAFGHGQSMSILNSFYHRSSVHWIGQACNVLTKVLGKSLVMGVRFSRPNNGEWFLQMIGVAYWTGMFYGCMRNAFRNSTRY